MEEQQAGIPTIQPNNSQDSSYIHSLSRRAKWKRIVVIVVTMVITLALLGFLFVWISLSGGISGAISGLKSAPDLNSPSIVAKREVIVGTINTSFEELDNLVGFNNYVTSTHDRCYEGQNNWKVHDGYAYRCTYRITKFYGFNGDFRQQMIDFEQKLNSVGWKSAYDYGYPIKKIMEDYYDTFYGTDKTPPYNFPEGYFVSSLPTPLGGYERNGEILEIEYAERATEDLFSIEYTQNVSHDTLVEVFDKKNFQNISSVFDKITSANNFVLVVSIQRDYFQD